MARKQSAIIPFKRVNSRIEIMFITTSSGKKWIIPKGKNEQEYPDHILAAKEACEEAGVLGKPYPICVGKYKYQSRKSSKVTYIPVYLMEVESELDGKHWLQKPKKKRKRQWVDADKCEEVNLVNGLLPIIKMGVQCLRFEDLYFMRAIETYCEEYNKFCCEECDKWKIFKNEAHKDKLKLGFQIPNGRGQFIDIERDGSIIKFSMPSFAAFNSEDELLDTISTILLKQNSTNKIGFWCVKKIKDKDNDKDKFVYTCMYNAKLKRLDSQYFAEIIKGLIRDCDALA